MAEFERERAQIFTSHTKNRVIDVTDNDPNPLEIYPFEKEKGKKSYAPRLVFNYCRYEEGKGAQAKHRHFVEIDNIHVLAHLLLRGAKGEKKNETDFSPIFEEFKGSPAGNENPYNVAADHILSRRMDVCYSTHMKGELRKYGPVYLFSFDVKDGRLGDKGQVMPVKGGTTYLQEQIALSLFECMQMGVAIDRWLTAKMAAALLMKFQNP